MARKLGFIAADKGFGKTTLVTSASDAVPDTFEELMKQSAEGKTFDCSDVAILQGDADGDMGPIGLGMHPRVFDMSHLNTAPWKQFEDEWKKNVATLLPLIKSGEVKHIGVDFTILTELAKEFGLQADPGFGGWTIAASKINDALKPLRQSGVNIFLMTHLKAYNPTFKGPKTATQADIEAAAAKAELVSGGHAVDFVLAVPYVLMAQIHRDAAFVWVPRRSVEERIVGGKSTPVTKHWVDTTLTTYAPSMTKGVNPLKPAVAPQEQRTMKAMLASMEALRGTQKGA